MFGYGRVPLPFCLIRYCLKKKGDEWRFASSSFLSLLCVQNISYHAALNVDFEFLYVGAPGDDNP